jgi:hypothetical protein
MDIFAENIHCGSKALRVEIARDADRIRYGFAGNVPLRNAPDHGLWNDG